MGYKAPTKERLNGKWRKYTCAKCDSKFEVFTIDPLPKDGRLCGYCNSEVPQYA